MGEVCSSSRGQQPVWFSLRVAVAVLSSSLILDGRGALGRATTAAVGSDSPGSPGSASLRNATAVLLKPRGSSDIHKVSARWSALNAMPWSADVDHLVFIELKRVDPARIGLIQKAMGGRATIVDVSDEFEPAAARRSGDVDCPSNPTSNYFSFGYKAMCRFWYGRAWHYLSSYAYVLRVDDDCNLLHGSWPDHPGSPVVPVVYQGMDPEVVTVGVTGLFGLGQYTDSALWDRHAKTWRRNQRGSWNSPYTNVMLVDVRWARGTAAQSWFDKVDATGCVFRNRWGDLPLWGAMMAAMSIPRHTLKGWAYTHGSHSRTCSCTVSGPTERGSDMCVLPIGEVVKETALAKEAHAKPSTPPTAATIPRQTALPSRDDRVAEPLVVLNVAYCRPSLFQHVFARAFPGREVRVLAPEDPGHEEAEVAIIGHRMMYNHDAAWQLKAYRALRNKKMRHVITVSGENENEKGPVDSGLYTKLPCIACRVPLVHVRTNIIEPNPNRFRNLYCPWGAQQYDPRHFTRTRGGNRTGFLAYLNRDCRSHRDRLFQLLRPDGATQLGTCGGVAGTHNHIPGRVSTVYQGYRFGMAMENSYAPGYLTEKLGMVFESGAVPVFWGDSGIAATIFNPEAFIDVGAAESIEAAAAQIRAVASNATRYEAMRAAEVFRGGDDHACFSNAAIALCVGDAIRKAIDPTVNIAVSGCCVDPPRPSRRPRWK